MPLEVEMALKELVSELYDLFPVMTDSIELLQKGLLYNNLKAVQEGGAALARIHEREVPLTEALVKEGKTESQAGHYVAVPAHIERLVQNIERISTCLQGKIREDVLFSDKAMSELNFLFEKIKDILVNTKDMVLARNTILAGYIKEAAHAVTLSANDFSTRHEERLIEGLCLPRASSMYLELLDAFKGVAWHAKEVARDLIGEGAQPLSPR